MASAADIDIRRENRPVFATGQRPRIMVVDDDPIIGCVLAGALNRGGFDVEIFTSPIEALKSPDRTVVDLVVADWIMPGLDGLNLIDALRDRNPDLPALLITSYGDHETVIEAQSEGRVNAVLTKPFDLNKFLNIISAHVAERDQAVRRHIQPGATGDKPDRVPSAGAFHPAPVDSWAALSSRESYYEKLLDSVIDAVVMIDTKGRIVYRNLGAVRMFGFTEPVSDTVSIADICPDDCWLPVNLPNYFKPHPPVEEQYEGFLRRFDGREFYAMYSISLFASDDLGASVILVIKDIDDQYQIRKDISNHARDLERLAMTDPLTGIFNRRYFDRKLEEEFKRLERYGTPLSLVMIDFDHFKRINDTFGHLAGDKVLALAAQKFSGCLRDLDVPARWGGEEFMVLLPQTGPREGQAVAERLHRVISGYSGWPGLTADYRVTISLGLISLPWKAELGRPQVTEVLRLLDQALYLAKALGRDRIVRYDGDNGILEQAC